MKSKNITLIDFLEMRSTDQPKQVAYRFLSDEGLTGTSLTYQELDRQARAIAAKLQERGATGERVLLVYPPGLSYIVAFFGCLYAGAVAVPIYPPRRKSSLLRIQTIAADSQAKFALTTTQILLKHRSLLKSDKDYQSIHWIDTDILGTELADDYQREAITQSSLAFLQYTSGSTGEPKGVMISHGNLLHNQHLIQSIFHQTEKSIIVSWLPLYHDMGLIGNILQPLYLGALCILMSPMSFLQRPFRWLDVITHYRATTSGGPNFAYDLCVCKITNEQKASLDLSSWSVAFNGSETVRANTLNRFTDAFKECGFRKESFYPCYGLAEATLIISGKRNSGPPMVKRFEETQTKYLQEVKVADDNDDFQSRVSCGETQMDQRILLVDPQTRIECNPGKIGEIWIAGQSVAQGYWNRPEETERLFGTRLNSNDDTRFLRTGDLGFIHQRNLFLMGRIKDLIIIHGVNYYPQDIELLAQQSHPALLPNSGAAFSIEVENEERLVLINEINWRKKSDFYEIFKNISLSIAENFDLQVHSIVLVKNATLPKTSSGKIRRHICYKRFLAGALETVAQWIQSQTTIKTQPNIIDKASIQTWIISRLASWLNLKESEVGINQSLSSYCVGSLNTMELMHEIENKFGITLPLANLLEDPTIEELTDRINILLHLPRQSQHHLLPPRNVPFTRLPLSYGQQALWFLHRLEPESAAYNISFAAKIRGNLDSQTLKNAFQKIVERHSALRTTFLADSSGPAQIVHDKATISYKQEYATEWNEQTLRNRLNQEAVRPFDLEHGPLLRVHLFQRSKLENILLLTIHHIVADFWSIEIMLDELEKYYRAEQEGEIIRIEAPALDYSQFVQMQKELLISSEGEKLWNYWLKQLEGEVPVLNWLIGKPRPSIQNFKGACETFHLSSDLTGQMTNIATTHATTLFVVLLGIFQLLIHRLSGQNDITIGTPTAGRNRANLAGLIGYFVNSVVIRSRLSANISFSELLKQTRKTVLDALTHQELPFSLLADRLQTDRTLSNSPVFSVMFIQQQAHFSSHSGLSTFALGRQGTNIKWNGLNLESITVDHQSSQFDLTLMTAVAENGVEATVQYSLDLFDAEVILRLISHFQVLARSAISNPGQPVSQYSLLTDVEQQQVIIEWNDTSTNYGDGHLLHKLFSNQVRRTPDRICVAFEDKQLTFQELDRRTTQAARYLVNKGVGPDVIVGIFMFRSIEMVIGLLSVLKAGGTYLPLDPTLPKERIAFILDNACVSLILTYSLLEEIVPKTTVEFISIDTDSELAASRMNNVQGIGLDSQNLAYVIYTSGSTGKPKGVMITHDGICNRLLWMQNFYKLNGNHRVLQKTPFNFDVSVWEFFLPLISGASLILSRVGGAEDPTYIANIIILEGITTIHFVPSMLQQFLCEDGVEKCSCLKQVICSGEALSAELQAHFHSKMDSKLYNLYGPTEASIDVTFWECKLNQHLHSVPIGRPIANISSYIFDHQLSTVAVGMLGELCLAGIGLSRGYLNTPEATADRFIPHPYCNDVGLRLYQTGDLARYLSDGSIEYLGRIDHQVKIRGFRIELGEISSILEDHLLVREAVVLVCNPDSDSKRLIGYLVPARKQNGLQSLLREYLKEKLPAYMVPHSLVILDVMPLLPNGKLDRKALSMMNNSDIGESKLYSPPRSPFETIIVEIWRLVLGIQRIGIHDNFFELGGNSLLAIQTISRIRAAFSLDISVRSVFDAPTPAELALCIQVARGNRQQANVPPLVWVERGQSLPLSFAQERLWFLAKLNLQDPGYNIAAAVRISGGFNLPALEQSLSQIVNRHEVLRTHFEMQGDQLSQIIENNYHLKIQLIDLSGFHNIDKEKQVKLLIEYESLRPFDPSRGPLFRAIIFRFKENDNLLLLTMHHLVSDGWSLNVLTNELEKLYESYTKGQASLLAPLPIQYIDYALWQREWFTKEIFEKQLIYWREHIGSDHPVIQLPADHPRPPILTSRGDVRTQDLSGIVNESLQELNQREAVTQFMTLLAAFAILLYRYSAQAEIVVGTPVANRNRSELENLIGFFVNTLVLRISLSTDVSFRQLLQHVREIALGAYEHQDLPFDKLVEALQPKRELSMTPLFQIMFTWQKKNPELTLSGSVTTPYKIPTTGAKFDLGLAIIEDRDQLQAALEFRTDLFESSTIERMAGHFHNLVVAAIASPNISILQLPIFTKVEAQQLLVEWNDTESYFPADQCIHQLFEAQVERGQDIIAAIDGSEHLTYCKLNEKANQLAHFLKKAGVDRENRVGVCLDRSIDIIIAFFGVLKSGGAYTPLVPTYPKEHLNYLVKDSQPAILLTCERYLNNVLFSGLSTICLDNSWETIFLESGSNAKSNVCSENIAYVIYTSGSTGKQKGVMVPHIGLSNLIPASIEIFGIQPGIRMAQHVSPSFDGAIWECLITLLAGATLCTGSREELIPGSQLQRWMEKNAISAALLIPSFLELLSSDGLDQLDTIISGAERVSNETALCWSSNRHFFNSYGVTETTINTTITECKDHNITPPSVGRPNPNTAFYITDEHLQPVPIGVSGEGHIGGIGLARGYLNRPDLTAEKFIPNAMGSEIGGRLYRTGDLLCYRADGSLDFKGRIDHQVKIHGHRIEISEIEEALTLCTGGGQIIVNAIENNSGDTQLVAYLMSDPAVAPSIAELRKSLGQMLPDYLIPSTFIIMESFPLTPNGKVDRRNLPQPDQALINLEIQYIAPQNHLEKALCSIWEHVLKVDRVGVENNFFDLGGHSLLLGQVHALLVESQNIDVSFLELFQFTTIRSLANHLSNKTNSNGEPLKAIGENVRERKKGLRQRLDRSRLLKLNGRENE